MQGKIGVGWDEEFDAEIRQKRTPVGGRFMKSGGGTKNKIADRVIQLGRDKIEEVPHNTTVPQGLKSRMENT